MRSMQSVSRILLVACAVIAVGALDASAAYSKHPRVLELESVMNKDASAHLRSRFPDLPFLISVSIDPLFRYDANEGKAGTSERLPYFDVENEEIRDEWDDPKLSVYELIPRIRKMNVSISLPDSVSDGETAEMKTFLTTALSLVPGRDEIKVERKSWSRKGDFSWTYIALSIGLISLLFLGYLLVSLVSSKRIATAFKENRAPSPSPTSGSASLGSAKVEAPSWQSKSSSRPDSGHLNFNDPLKVAEAGRVLARALSDHASFPVLAQLTELDRLASVNPSDLGAILLEFPLSLQKKLFGFSAHPGWMAALTEPGTLTLGCLESLQKLLRSARELDAEEQRVENMLICFWRLGDMRLKFSKQISQETAFSLLQALPKSICIETAKRAFPGSWGLLLDPAYKAKEISSEEIDSLSEKMKTLKPLNDFSLLVDYRHQRELLEYVRLADFLDEKEVYEALPDDSMLSQLRPPFYRVFDLKTETLQRLVASVSIDYWALALFNIPRIERSKIEQLLSEKQRFVLRERFKSMDQAFRNPEDLESARELISRSAQSLDKNAYRQEVASETLVPSDVRNEAA